MQDSIFGAETRIATLNQYIVRTTAPINVVAYVFSIC